MGHGGHGGMSMDASVCDMRNRFLMAAVLSVPILLWSPIGRDVLIVAVNTLILKRLRHPRSRGQPAPLDQPKAPPWQKHSRTHLTTAAALTGG